MVFRGKFHFSIILSLFYLSIGFVMVSGYSVSILHLSLYLGCCTSESILNPEGNTQNGPLKECS